MTAPLTRLRSLLSAATARPWKWWTSNSFRRLSGADGKDGGVLYAVRHPHDGQCDIVGSQANKDLIVAAVNALPQLIRIAEAAEAFHQAQIGELKPTAQYVAAWAELKSALAALEAP